jgi:creatinine amidohydrolase
LPVDEIERIEPMNWSTLQREGLDAIDRRTPVILPVGATEQHGRHLPLGTDAMIGDAIVQKLDGLFDGRLLILPSQRIGVSEHHMKFPGTLTLTHETLRRCVSDLADSVIRHGFRRLVLLNSHGGNQSILGVLGEQIPQRWPGVECLVANWWSAAAERLKKLQEGPIGSVGHACEFETSLMLAIAPELVDMTLAEDDGVQHRVPSMWFDLLRGPAATCYRPFEVLSPSGVFGKPSLASAEKGQRILDEATAALHELIAGFWPDFVE